MTCANSHILVFYSASFSGDNRNLSSSEKFKYMYSLGMRLFSEDSCTSHQNITDLIMLIEKNLRSLLVNGLVVMRPPPRATYLLTSYF